jgi:hypothetical protein
MSLSFLKAEIAKKKRKLEEDDLFKTKKYVKLGEIEEQRQKEYIERQREKEARRRVRFCSRLHALTSHRIEFSVSFSAESCE